MAVGIAHIAKKQLSIVLAEHSAGKAHGWGAIAKKLGMKPGSKEFKALKDGASVQLGKIKGKGKTEKPPAKKPKRGKRK
jgi:hypothetical protein